MTHVATTAARVTRPRRSTAARRHLAGGAAVLLTGAALSLAPASAQAAESGSSAAQSQPGARAGTTGWIRAGHLAVGVGAADLWMTPYSGGKPIAMKDVSYRDVTPYASVPSGLYTLAVFPHGASRTSTPMVSANVVVDPGSATSVFAVQNRGEVVGRVFSDNLRTPRSGAARVRVISAVPEKEDVTARLGAAGDVAAGLGPGKSSGYSTVPAKTYDLTLRAAGGEASSSVSRRVLLSSGGVYTFVAVPDEAGKVRLLALEDAGGTSMAPQGGVDTGGGWLATHTDSSDSVVSGPVLAGGFALGLGGLALVAGLGALRRELVRRAPRGQ